ncbi:hypothetical protein C7S15_3359 [Burkholderia cepacia]|nr:hypothetical protein [Burkholderia cepacia]
MCEGAHADHACATRAYRATKRTTAGLIDRQRLLRPRESAASSVAAAHTDQI